MTILLRITFASTSCSLQVPATGQDAIYAACRISAGGIGQVGRDWGFEADEEQGTMSWGSTCARMSVPPISTVAQGHPTSTLVHVDMYLLPRILIHLPAP